MVCKPGFKRGQGDPTVFGGGDYNAARKRAIMVTDVETIWYNSVDKVYNYKFEKEDRLKDLGIYEHALSYSHVQKSPRQRKRNKKPAIIRQEDVDRLLEIRERYKV